MTSGEGGAGPTPPGWYPDGSGGQRWWDGEQWTDHARPGVAPPRAPLAYSAANHSPPPPPPWGTWVWPDGQAIDLSTIPPYDSSKRVLAGVLALLFPFGVHKFVLGYNSEGIIQLLVTIFTCGLFGIVSFIEGIIYLTKSEPEFYWTYVAQRKPWF